MKEATQETDQETGQDNGKDKSQANGLGRWMRSELLMLVIALLAALVVFAIPIIRKHIIQVRMAVEYERQHKSAQALAEGLRLAAAADTRDQAFVSLRHALDSALTPAAHQDALLALGEFLLASANKSPEKFALPARQYFLIALAQETRPDRRLRALAGRLAVARLREDLGDLRSVCAEVQKEKLADGDKVAFLGVQLDAMLTLGQWRDIYGLLQELMPYETDPCFSAQVILRWAAVHEQVLNRKDYFALWRQTLPADGHTASDEELRCGLYTNLLHRLDTVGKGASGRAAEEAKFRAFRLVFNEGHFDEAGLRLENLHLNMLGAYERKAELLTIDLARRENHLRVFQERVLRYVEAYEIDADVEPFFCETLDLRIASGKGTEVLNLLDQKLTQITDPEQRARLLQYMGDMARRLSSDDVAERCYEEILNMPTAAAYHPKAMLARCSICAGRGELAAACQWLDRFLIRYPEAREWRDAAGPLLKRLRTRPEKGGADLVSITLILANRQPNDTLTGEFLALVAQQMENLGLSSLAHNYYTRVLLQPAQSAKPSSPGLQQEAPPAAVMLGSARCLLDLDRKLEADRMLRAVCSVQEPNETRSEAAILWAGMALDRDQQREGERRLGLVDFRHSDTNVLWQVTVNRLLLRMPSATNAAAAATELLAAMRDPAALHYPELVRKTYETCFATMVAHNDAAGLRMAFASTNAVLSANALDAFRLRIAKQYLSVQNYAAAGEWLQQSSLAISNVVAVISKNNQMLQRYR